MQNLNKMIKIDKNEQDCKNRKEYLVRLAIAYIKDHTGYIGIDDQIFMDDETCDGYALAEDLINEFQIEDEM